MEKSFAGSHISLGIATLCVKGGIFACLDSQLRAAHFYDIQSYVSFDLHRALGGRINFGVSC